MGSVNNILKAQNVCRAAKIRIHKTVIRPVAVYASESWTMNKKDGMKIEIWERKVLQKSFAGIRTAEGNWRRKTNKEVMEMYEKPLNIKKVKAQRVRWLGQITRMPEKRVKKVIFGGGGGKMKRERQRKKWLGAVKGDLNGIEVQNCEVI
ncbi:uncharacterized protein [Diabrotica undecimpunctata]|uniref:uncharacterized protein n=1 Tax=Diabrotica undecimpunctata TaxID=50387 RepID=UPI003B638CBB